MNDDQIRALTVLVPEKDPYFRMMLRHHPGVRLRSLSLRLAVTLRDPCLPWNFALSHGREKCPLPQFPWDPAVYRAHEFVLNPQRTDKNLSLAIELYRPEQQLVRDVIQALILCRGCTDESIAGLLHLETEAISLVEKLFWNCRQRRDDLLFLTHLLNTTTTGVCNLQTDQAEHGRQLLRIALQSGNPASVLAHAKLARHSDLPSDEVLAKQIEDLLRELAVRGNQQAQLLIDEFLTTDPDVHHASALDDLFELSQSKEAQQVLMGVVNRNTQDILTAEREDREREAAEEAAKRKDKPNSP